MWNLSKAKGALTSELGVCEHITAVSQALRWIWKGKWPAWSVSFLFMFHYGLPVHKYLKLSNVVPVIQRWLSRLARIWRKFTTRTKIGLAPKQGQVSALFFPLSMVLGTFGKVLLGRVRNSQLVSTLVVQIIFVLCLVLFSLASGHSSYSLTTSPFFCSAWFNCLFIDLISLVIDLKLCISK